MATAMNVPQSTTTKMRLATAVGLGLIALAHAQLGHETHNAANHAGSDGFHGLRPSPGLSMKTAIHYREVHGILAATSIAVLFPLGSILMRIVPGRSAIWVHAIFQMLSTAIYIAAAGLGIYLVKNVNIARNGGTSSFLSNPRTSLHPIMGIVTLITLLPQPILGYMHHKKFKQVQRRQFWSYMHIFNGRIGVTVGIANGYMGLNLADAPSYYKKAYIIVAATLWALWVLTAVFSEVRRLRANRRTERAMRRRLAQGTTNLKSEPSSERSH